MTASIISLPPSQHALQQARRELALAYIFVDTRLRSRLSPQDRRAFEQIGDFIQYGGLRETWASISHNNEVLKRIIQRAQQPPTRWQRLVRWLNEVPAW